MTVRSVNASNVTQDVLIAVSSLAPNLPAWQHTGAATARASGPLRILVAADDPFERRVADALAALTADRVHYLLSDTLRGCGITRANVVSDITTAPAAPIIDSAGVGMRAASVAGSSGAGSRRSLLWSPP